MKLENFEPAIPIIWHMSTKLHCPITYHASGWLKGILSCNEELMDTMGETMAGKTTGNNYYILKLLNTDEEGAWGDGICMKAVKHWIDVSKKEGDKCTHA
eukprot:10111000-Ditylum_brightwellii.AAC.1